MTTNTTTMFEVKLAIYDLSRGMARTLSQSLLGQHIDGIWHTGIIIYNKEYYFGGGIQVLPWGQFTSQNNLPPSNIQLLGYTSKTQSELEHFLYSIRNQYTTLTYDLIRNNCNHFADTVSKFLLNGQGIPSTIVNLPEMIFSTPGGAMLRPMIESMQNNVRQQQGVGLDPFHSVHSNSPNEPTGATTPTSSSGTSFENALSDSVTSMVLEMAQQAEQQREQAARGKIAKKAVLEEQPFISADASSVPKLMNKLLALSDLNDEQKERLQTIAMALQSSQVNAVFSVDDYYLLENILASHPETHLSTLFIVRLMFLHDRMTDFKEVRLIKEILSRLLVKDVAQGKAEGAQVSGFASVPAHAMALCAISNLLSHEAGLALLCPTPLTPAKQDDLTNTSNDVAGSNLSAELTNDILDTVLAGLAHGRAEVRQMSATLAYNLTLACTPRGQLAGPWAPSSSSAGEEIELHSQALQLLCACLEGLSTEQDSLVRKRKLAVACRILRAFGKAAADLVQDLGLDGALQVLRQTSLPNEELAIVDEIIATIR